MGLTRQTEIGMGRARIAAAMPLAVQVFLPRFAVERDRHRGRGPDPQQHGEATARATWRGRSTGARAETPQGDANRVARHRARTARSLVQGRVAVAAGKSARVPLPLVFERIDEVQVTLRAGDGHRLPMPRSAR